MADSRLPRAGLILAGAILVVSIANASGSDAPSGGGPLFAVIPTLGIGGPLAILALLFPSLFGGVLVLFRQWGAFFAVVSVNSLLYCLQWWFASSLENSWWGTQTALWLVMTFVTLWGAAWAWRRNVTALRTGNLPEAPAQTEHRILWLLSVCCALTFAYFAWAKLPFNAMWALMLVLTVGLWVGTLYKAYRAVVARGSMAGDLPTEGVMLGTMLAGCIVFVSWQARPSSSAAPAGAVNAILLERVDPFYGPDAVGFGMVLSSPLVSGEHVYVGLAEPDPGGNREKGMGAVFCIDQKTNKIAWTFNDEGKMQPVYSSPTVADGRLFIGEGFHYNPNCKLYCLDAKSGKKLWDFTTKSQVEATPFVAEGKVFFGAGNDGVYALDAETGKEIWRYGQATPVFRVGSGPIVSRGKVFFGSGVDRVIEEETPGLCETALVCLDAEKGKEIWKVKVKLPCWAAPVLAGDNVLFALGNGDIYTDPPDAAGTVLCLDGRNGKEIWHFDVPKGVHTRPAVDGQSVYFGCRDGFYYCVDLKKGKERWKTDLGSPIFASPALDLFDEINPKLFVAATGGRVCCLDPQSGKVQWVFQDLEQRDALLASSPTVALVSTPEGTHRKIYLGVSLKTSNRPYLYCLDDALLSAALTKGEAK